MKGHSSTSHGATMRSTPGVAFTRRTAYISSSPLRSSTIGSRRPSRPLESDVVRRLGATRSLPAIYSMSEYGIGKKCFPGTITSKPNDNRAAQESGSPSDAELKLGVLRKSLSRHVLATAPQALQTEGRRKISVRRNMKDMITSAIHEHRERIGPREERLTMEQEAALTACFAALEVESPVGNNSRARVRGTINLDELSLALKSLGYHRDDEELMMSQSIFSDIDGDERLSLDEFIKLFTRGPKPPACMKRLSSIGKVVIGVHREAAEQAADLNAGAHVVHSQEGRKTTEMRLERLTDIANEAFPFSIVTDSHRISSLISSYAVVEKTQPRPSPNSKGARMRRLAAMSSVSRRSRIDVYEVGNTIEAGTFREPEELLEWLAHMGIDTSGWGKGAAKTAKELLAEIDQRETVIQKLEGKVYRCLQVAKLVVRPSLQDARSVPEHLMCKSQTMKDGRKRERNQLPSEKMLYGEDIVHAARRTVEEELSNVKDGDEVRPERVHIRPATLLSWYEITDSPSYPGLHTQYHLHELTVEIGGFPPVGFTTVEGKKEHHWEWIEDRPDDLRRKKKD